MRLLPEDPKQALRCRRILMAAAAYGVWLGLGAFLYVVDLLRIELLDLASYFLVILSTNLGFYLLVRAGGNLRFTDPSMTFVQIAVSIIFAMWFVAAVEPLARGVTLLLFISGLFFGVFRLRTSQFLALAFFAVGLYAALIIWETQALGLAGRPLQVEIAQGVVLGAVLFWMALMGGYVARLRGDLRQAMRRIEVLANTDDLTGTENRRSISAALQEAIASEGRLAVCLLDLDGFKAINDQYGHPVGDEILREFVARVESTLRSRDRVERGGWPGALGRFGGEEFLVVLRGSDEEGGRQAAERILVAVTGEPFQTAGGTVRVTVSAGVAAWRPGESEVDLLRRADRALYRAKEEGRNRVIVADRARSEEGSSRSQRDHEAPENGEGSERVRPPSDNLQE